MSGWAVAVTRAARKARLHELAADWMPELAATLARTKRIPGELVAEAVAGLDNPVAMFAALAPYVEVEALVRAARSVRRARARASSLGAILGVAPELADEALSLAEPFEGADRVHALVDGFPHLSADLQAAVLPALAPGLSRSGYGAQRIARGVRPEAFRTAWDLFARTNPADVTSASILAAVAPEDERAALRTTLVARVCAGGELAYSAIRELLPSATGEDRQALIERAFRFGGRYAAANIERALGHAIVEPEVEARFVAFLDLARQDYPWDLTRAYADVAARRSPNRERCLVRASALLDRILDPSVGGVNPYPMTAEAGRIPTALAHQVNALLAVTRALDGEARAHREQQVLAWLTRVCPEHSSDDLVPIAWGRTTVLAPELRAALLDTVATIQENAAVFAAFAEIMAADRRLEDAALDLVMARIERHDFDVASAVAALRAPVVAPTTSPAVPVASLGARRVATPDEIAHALSSRVLVGRIDAVARLAREASAATLPPIEDPFVAAVANVLLQDAPAAGVIAQLDSLLARDRRRWESYCCAARAIAPRLDTSERIDSIKTILGMKVDVHPRPDVRAVFVGLEPRAWPAIARLVKGMADSALPADAIAAAVAHVPAEHAEELVRAVLCFAPGPPLLELCETVRAHGLLDRAREDLAGFIAHHGWRSLSELVAALTTCASLITDSDERDEIANALTASPRAW